MFSFALICGLSGAPMMLSPELNLQIILVTTKRRSDIHRGQGRRDENYQGKILETQFPTMDHIRRA